MVRVHYLSRADDPFVHTRMPFGEHIEDLRTHLMRALFGFGAALALVFGLDCVGCVLDQPIGIAYPVKNLIALPVERALQEFYERRVDRVLANLEDDPELRRVNQPTPFVRVGFYRDQLLAVLSGQPVTIVNGYPRPTTEGHVAQPGGTAAVAITGADVYQLWMRYEEPLRDAALRQEAQRQVGRRPTLATMNLSEAMMVYLKVALACSVILASPWILWQLWSFIAAGLYPHEKRPLYIYLPFSLCLFLGGILVCQFLVLPKAIEALLWFNEWLDLEPDFRLNEWIGFAILMPLVFGISFQTPLIMLLLERLGLIRLESFRAHRRLAWLLLAIFAALITPSVDAFGLLYLWLPMGLLYELGILLGGFAHRRSKYEEVDRTEVTEIVEV